MATAASGRTSPLAALSPSLPSSTSGMSHADDRHGRHDGDGLGDGAWDEVEEGDTTRLSMLDPFRRQLNESADGDEIGCRSHSEDEGERVLCLGEKKDERGASASEDEKEDDREEGEDAHSDGEVGIGLSFMGALGGEDDELEDRKTDAEPVKKTRGGNVSESGAGNVGVGADGNASGVSSENGGMTAMAWTRYTPTSLVSAGDLNGHRRTGEEEDGGGNEEEDEDEDEDEDDGGYWDDIYDDYRYSRYSLASKRYSATSKRASIVSKASGASKASSKARANVPPMPVPPDWSSFDASRPSIGSDATSGRSRPSLESASSSISASMPFTRPSLTRSASDESTHETHVLPLTAQFPAVPEHVPVRTESRLRVVHDGYMQGGDDHEERELQVVHGSTEEDVVEVGLSIEVVEVAEEDDTQGQEVDLGRPFTSLNANAALSPLLHTRFGSPHSSRFTDFEDGSDQDGRRSSNKSGKSMMSSVEGPAKSPTDGGGMASALRARMEAERTPSSDSAPSLIVPAPTADSSSSGELGVRAIVVDDEEGRVTDIHITVNDPILATEATSPLATPSVQTPIVAQATVATDPAQGPLSANQPDGAEKSPFLRTRPQPSQHPFSRTSMFLPHPNAPKAAHQSQGPMYGRTAPQPYVYPVPSGPGAGNTIHPLTPPGTTFYSTHILHQLRSVSIAASQGPARRPPMTLFARCEPELSPSLSPVPILFSLDPLPPLPTAPARPHTKMGSGKGVHYSANMAPTRAATVSAPVRRGGGDGMPPNEVGPRAGDPSLLRPPKRSATAVASVGGPQGIDAGPSSSLPIPREGFVPQVGAARPRSRSFSDFGARVSGATPQERWSVVVCVPGL
jgi:hypothetical protein